MSRPLVSIVLPAYNGERFIAEGIESLLAQPYENMEILVVDDGSTDATAAIVQRYPKVRYVYQDNSGGPARGRNRGVEMARGELISFLDQDDLWPENKLAPQVDYLAAHSDVDIVLGKAQIMRLAIEEDGSERFVPVDETPVNLLVGSGLFRKSVFDLVGRFDETLQVSDDVDWFLRARESTATLAILEETTLYYRLHQSNTINDRKKRDAEFIRALKKSIDRRRKQPERERSEERSFLSFQR